MAPIPRQATVCVTGAGGYVGGWIVKMLLDKGHSVRACVRDAASERNDFLRQMPGYFTGRLTLHSCDLCKAGSLDAALSGSHGLVHVAADPDVPLEKRPEEYRSCSQHLIDSVRKTDSVLRVIYTSSAAAIFGDTDLRELQLRPSIDEARYPNMDSAHHVNGYVEGKLQCERLLLEAAKSSNGRWDVLITNPADNIGPLLSSSHAAIRKAWIPWHCTIAEILTKGTFRQSYGFRPWWTVDVRDTAEVHVRLLESSVAAGKQDTGHSCRYFVCSTESIKVEEIGSSIASSLSQACLDMNDLQVYGSKTEEEFLCSLGMTVEDARKIWAGCILCNEKVCTTLGVTFRRLEDSLRDCAESLISVAGVKPRILAQLKNGNKRGAADDGIKGELGRCARPRLDAPVSRAATVSEIPIIDVAELISGRPGSVGAIAPQIKQACIGTGFFYVSNHGLEEHLAALLKSMRKYFDTPEADKATASIDKYQRGFRGQGHDQEPGRMPDCKESFDIGVDLPLTHPAVLNGIAMHGPNQWPSHFPALRAPADEYFAACEKLGRSILAAIACSLGEPEDFFEPHCSEPMVQMRMFHYPPPPEGQAGLYGSSPHTDYGMITLLAQDPIGGLEVQTLTGEWVSAPYIEGTLVINIGDMLSRWTNDIYHSTLHRVINRARRDRYSVAMFYHLNAESLVTPFSSCSGDNATVKYQPIKYLSHIVSRFEEVLKAKF